MAPSSPSIDEKARRLESDLLRAVAARGQQHIAVDLGIDDSTFSRFMNAEREKGIVRVCRFLASLGLKVVADDTPTFDSRYVEALETLAHAHIECRRQASAGRKCPHARHEDLCD